MKLLSYLKLFLSIFAVLVLHQFVVLLYTIGVTVAYGIENAEAFNAGTITDEMLTEAVLLQAANSLIFAGVVMIGFYGF
jgi:hypothetical protein